MPHNHDKQYSKILEYLIDLNFLKTMLPDHGMYCVMQLLSLLDFSFTISLCFSNFNFIFYTTGKISQNNPKMCWHIYTRPPIGFTTSECFISCKMCSDKISLILGMIKHMLMSLLMQILISNFHIRMVKPTNSISFFYYIIHKLILFSHFA